MKNTHVSLAAAVTLVGLIGGSSGIHAQDKGIAPAGSEIVVTATRTSRGSYELPASVQVLDQEVLRSLNAVTLDQALRIGLGVDVQGGGWPGESVKINMRGLSTGYQCDRVLVLMDGRRLNDAFQGNVDLAAFPLWNIERIEVLRGPASALYGSNAEGGVINIITRSGRDISRGEVTALAGSHGLQKYDAAYGGVSGASDYSAAAGFVRTDGYARNSDGTRRDWDAWNGSINAGIEIGENASARFDVGVSEGKGTGEFSERTARRDRQAVFFESLWDGDRDARLKISLYRNGALDIYDWKYPGEGEYREDTLVGEAVQSLWVGERHLATGGFEVRRESVDVEDVQYSLNRSTMTFAMFGQDELNLNEHLAVVAGARFDHHPDIQDRLDPRLGALWKINKNSEAFASVNVAHRAPALSDRFVKVEYQGALFEGNPDLKPEILTGYEAGYRQRARDRINVEVSAFWNRMKDTFDFMPVSNGLFRSQNVTRLWTAGIETSAKWLIRDGLSMWANYTFIDGSYDEFSDPSAVGKRPAYIARHQATAGLKAEIKDKADGLLTVRFCGDRYGDPQNSDARKMSEYAVADARARIGVWENAWVLLGVDNIFNKKYQEYPGVGRPGRVVIAGLNISF